MKILVDEMPSKPEECLESLPIEEPSIHQQVLGDNHKCGKCKDRELVCSIGEEDFECPYYREFKATAGKYVYQRDAVVGEIRYPVHLE